MFIKLASSQFIIYNQVYMSIHNLIHKINSRIGLDKLTLIYLLIIIGVGVSSFGLGRLSINNKPREDANIAITETKNLLESQPTEKRYVASKNGKMYYSLGCSGAKRIKLENEIWFNTKEDAEKSGYTLSTTCK